MPGYASFSKSLLQPGVMIKLLWKKYVDAGRHNYQPYYRLTQFKKYFNDHLNQQSFSHIIKHKVDENIEVDWTGTKSQWIDPDIWEHIYDYLFVSVLPF